MELGNPYRAWPGVAHFTILLSEISPERLALMPGTLGSVRAGDVKMLSCLIVTDSLWHAWITSNPQNVKVSSPQNWMISNVIHFIRSGPQSTHGCKSPARVCPWTGEVVPTPSQCALADLTGKMGKYEWDLVSQEFHRSLTFCLLMTRKSFKELHDCPKDWVLNEHWQNPSFWVLQLWML